MSECEQSSKCGAYHDGELDAPARIDFERHLRTCPACAAEIERIALISSLVSQALRPVPSSRAMRRFHAAAEMAPALTIRHMAEALTAVAAAILVSCCAWMWSNLSSSDGAGAMPVWEASALEQPADASGGSEDQFATWVVQDLSRESGNGQN
jgi:anti-sigma factor RsiW